MSLPVRPLCLATATWYIISTVDAYNFWPFRRHSVSRRVISFSLGEPSGDTAGYTPGRGTGCFGGGSCTPADSYYCNDTVNQCRRTPMLKRFQHRRGCHHSRLASPHHMLYAYLAITVRVQQIDDCIAQIGAGGPCLARPSAQFLRRPLACHGAELSTH